MRRYPDTEGGSTPTIGRLPPNPPSPTFAASSDSLTKPFDKARQKLAFAVSVEDDPVSFITIPGQSRASILLSHGTEAVFSTPGDDH